MLTFAFDVCFHYTCDAIRTKKVEPLPILPVAVALLLQYRKLCFNYNLYSSVKTPNDCRKCTASFWLYGNQPLNTFSPAAKSIFLPEPCFIVYSSFLCPCSFSMPISLKSILLDLCQHWAFCTAAKYKLHTELNYVVGMIKLLLIYITKISIFVCFFLISSLIFYHTHQMGYAFFLICWASTVLG